MKFQVKTTALAILVSLGVVGCKSTDTSSQKVDPTPINQPEQPQPQPEQPQPQPEQPQPQPEQPQPQPEHPQPQPEQPQPQPEQPQPQPEQPQPQPEQPQPQPEQPQPQPDSAVNLLDKNGVEWRQVTLSDYGDSGSRHPSKSALVLKDIHIADLKINDHSTYNAHSNTTVESPFEWEQEEKEYWINLNTESAKDGKPFIGSHQGSIKGNFRGEVVKSVEIDRSLENPRILTKGNVTQINYLYVNQPYSSYGFLFTPEDNQSRAFAVLQPANYSKYSKVEDSVVRDEMVSGSPTGRIIWNDGIAGDATYKGDIIAAYSEEPISKDLVGTEKVLAPHVDGTITINAHFGNTWDKTKMSGEIDSKILGKDTFTNVRIESIAGDENLGNRYFYTDKTPSRMNVFFAGPQLTEAVGGISHSVRSMDMIKEYRAVFGATKQPK